MNVRRDKFLSFARHLALLGASPLMAACGASNTTTTTTTTQPATSASNVSTSPPPVDTTAGSGPCRCSWDTNASAAPRVCKKGAINYEGQACIPGNGPSYDEGSIPVPGPLPPPDLQRYG